MSDTITHTFPLRLPDGTTTQATLKRRPRDATCWIQLAAGDIQDTSTSSDYFEAFTDIRRRLAKKNIFPLCYGASRDIWPSGMARDMGQGLRGYKLKMGIPGGEMFEIFATGPDINPVTPEEQKEYANRWFASIK